MGLNCLGETLAFANSCMRFHNDVADPSRNGRSANLLAGFIFLELDEQPPSAFLRDNS